MNRNLQALQIRKKLEEHTKNETIDSHISMRRLAGTNESRFNEGNDTITVNVIAYLQAVFKVSFNESSGVWKVETLVP